MTLLAFMLGCAAVRSFESAESIARWVRNDLILATLITTGISPRLVPTLLEVPKRPTSNNSAEAVALAAWGGVRG